MRARHLMTYALLAGLLLAPLAAGADNHEMAPKPLTWVSYVQSNPGQSTALAQHIAKGGAMIYDGMMADGDVLSWGVAMPINHRSGDGWNVMEWVTFRDWAAADTFMQHFMKMQMAKSPEESKADQEEWMSLAEPGSHFDEIVRHRVFKVKDTKMGYLKIGYHTAKPGQYAALTEQLTKLAMPVMAKVMETGAITSYGMASPEIHGGVNGTHAVWYGMTGLTAQDAVKAARSAAAKERGEEGQAAAMAALGAATDWSAHHDRVYLVIHQGGQGGGDGPAAGGDGDGDG